MKRVQRSTIANIQIRLFNLQQHRITLKSSVTAFKLDPINLLRPTRLLTVSLATTLRFKILIGKLC